MKLLQNRYIIYMTAAFLFDAVLFGFTNAADAPAFIVMLGFMALVATVWTVVYAICSLVRFYGFTMAHAQRLAFAVTLSIGIIVALQSVGQLGGHDTLVIVPLIVLGYGYTVYAKSVRRNFDG